MALQGGKGAQAANRSLPPIVRQISPPPKKRSPVVDDGDGAGARAGGAAERGEKQQMSAMERQAEGISEVLWTEKRAKQVWQALIGALC